MEPALKNLFIAMVIMALLVGINVLLTLGGMSPFAN